MTRHLRCCAIPLVLCLVGCGRNSSTIEGTVTFNGQIVKKGYITFFPIGSAHATRGSKIHDGKYEVTDLPPGKHRVQIRSLPNVRLVKDQRQQTQVQVIPTDSDIAPNDIGNNQVIDLTGDNQTINFQLRKRS